MYTFFLLYRTGAFFFSGILIRFVFIVESVFSPLREKTESLVCFFFLSNGRGGK